MMLTLIHLILLLAWGSASSHSTQVSLISR